MTSEKHVTVDGRAFLVSLRADGSAQHVKERKLHAPRKPWECWCNKPFWHAAHHPVGASPKALIYRILQAAGAKL